MEPWVIGLIALVVVGLAVIVFGALRDRQLNQRRATEMLAPPPRVIPQLPTDAAPPRYLSDLQARRPPAGASTTTLTDDQRSTIKTQLGLETTVTIPAGYATKAFVTDPQTGWAVLDQPVVLVCSDPVSSMRELLPVIEQLIMDSRALVVLAPALADDVRGTLEVNAIQRKLRVIAVTAEPAELTTVADAVGATPITRGDRQSGYLDPDALGRADRWVSTVKTSHVIR